jgi:hypothetical protein
MAAGAFPYLPALAAISFALPRKAFTERFTSALSTLDSSFSLYC